MSLDHFWFYVRHPRLRKWRKTGFNPDTYRKLTGRRFQQAGIKTVVDVGANTGQSVLMFQSAFPQAVIHAIEPLPGCFEQLKRNTAGMTNVYLYHTAVGSQTGSIVMEQNEYSPSSSVLVMADRHVQNFPHTRQRTPIPVSIDTLDNLLADKELSGPMLINIDVQGYEQAVIEGGQSVLARASVLLIEVSFEELYDGQPLFGDICAALLPLGFRYAGSFDQLASPLTGSILQQDAIFVRH